jgi:hypothetical protein
MYGRLNRTVSPSQLSRTTSGSTRALACSDRCLAGRNVGDTISSYDRLSDGRVWSAGGANHCTRGACAPHLNRTIIQAA